MGKTDRSTRFNSKDYTEKKQVAEVRTLYATEEWYRISNAAYNIQLNSAKKENIVNQRRPHVSVTPNEIIAEIFTLNSTLSNLALGIPVWATKSDYEKIKVFANQLPSSEQKIIDLIEGISMHPSWRARQQKGRFCQYVIFKDFNKIVDAALICYYRENYVSCFLTLAPVIEGVLLQWKGYDGVGAKPEFEEYRKFFRQGPLRQPCPANIQFHYVYCNVCDNILNKTLYKPTFEGDSHGDFNRHIALHLLKKSNFGTRNNCIRLFLLLDFMSEIYWYEGKFHDPRWDLHDNDVAIEQSVYGSLIIDNISIITAEKCLLK